MYVMNNQSHPFQLVDVQAIHVYMEFAAMQRMATHATAVELDLLEPIVKLPVSFFTHQIVQLRVAIFHGYHSIQFCFVCGAC